MLMAVMTVGRAPERPESGAALKEREESCPNLFLSTPWTLQGLISKCSHSGH